MRNLKPILISCLSIVFTLSSFSQILQYESSIETNADFINDMVETEDQSLLILGRLPDSIWNDTISEYPAFYHTLLNKISPEGELEWLKVYYNDTLNSFHASNIVKSNDGNYQLVGNRNDSIYILKINPEGDSIGFIQVNVPYVDTTWPRGIRIDKVLNSGDSDLMMIVNQTILYDYPMREGSFDSLYKDYNFTPISQFQCLKINSEGDILWSIIFDDEILRDIAINEDNELLVLINKKAEHDIISECLQGETNDFIPSSAKLAISVYKYDLDGNYKDEWNFPFVQGNVSSLAVNKSNEFYISYGSYFNSWGSIIHYDWDCPQPNYLSRFIIKADSFGNEIWTRKYPYFTGSAYALDNENLITENWPNIRTFNRKGDSINGYHYNYPSDQSSQWFIGYTNPLSILEGNRLYCTGIVSDGDSLYISKLNIDFISEGEYTQSDNFVQEIDVYPNPANNYFAVDLEYFRSSDQLTNILSENFKVMLFDAIGHQVMDVEIYFINNQLQLKVDRIASGLYFLNIYLPSGELVTEKVIIEHSN